VGLRRDRPCDILEHGQDRGCEPCAVESHQIADRSRPALRGEREYYSWDPTLDQYSFPSGHTMHAVAFSMIATAHHPELAWVLAPLSCLIATSRILLGLHYPTDVLAGGVIGAYVASMLQAA
jgi:undecaprenyl-diphosphatase